MKRNDVHNGRETDFNGGVTLRRVTGTDGRTVNHREYKRITCLECISFTYSHTPLPTGSLST